MLIKGNVIAETILNSVKKRVDNLPYPPVLCDIVVGKNLVIDKFVQIKGDTAKKVGINFVRKDFSVEAKTSEIVEFIKNESEFSGIIVQLPLPSSISKEDVLSSIPKNLDADVIGAEAKKEFYSGNSNLLPPTAAAIMDILGYISLNYGFAVENKKIVIVGRGELVGRPVEYLLKTKKLDVEVIDSKTSTPEKIILQADILISATGRPGLISNSLVKEGAIVIDAGTAESGGSIKGDVNTEAVLDSAGFLVPVPGGVGPVTVAKLLENVVALAEMK